MNWPIASLLLYLGLAVEIGLRGGLTIGQSASPSVMFALVALVAAYAPLQHALWFAFLAGLAVDLMSPLAPLGSGEAVVVVGPNAIGSLTGAYLVYLLRGFLFARNAATLTLLGIIGASAGGVVALALLQVRAITDPGVLFRRMGIVSVLLSAVYTGLPTLLLALVWKRMLPWLGLVDPSQRRYDRLGQGR